MFEIEFSKGGDRYLLRLQESSDQTQLRIGAKYFTFSLEGPNPEKTAAVSESVQKIFQEKPYADLDSLKDRFSAAEMSNITSKISRVAEPHFFSSIGERLDSASQYLARLRECDRFSGIVCIGVGDAPRIQQSFQPKTPVQKPFSDRMPWNIQSIGKLFTETSIFQLVEQGVLRLDDRVGDILSDEDLQLLDVGSHMRLKGPDRAAFRASAVTVGDLLKHHGGLIGGVSVPENGPPPGVSFDSGQIGTENYSNTGYILLAKIIEKRTEQPFVEYVDEHIFKPAGMGSASHYLRRPPEREEVAVGFDSRIPSGEIIPRDIRSPPPHGNGCFWMVPEDLYKFGYALQAGKLFQKGIETKELMLTKVHSAVEENGVRSYGHQGGAPNASSDLTIIEIDKSPPIISLVLSNFSGGNDAGIELKIALRDGEVLPPLQFQIDDAKFIQSLLHEDDPVKRAQILKAYCTPLPKIEFALPIAESFLEHKRGDLFLEFIRPFLAHAPNLDPLTHFANDIESRGHGPVAERLRQIIAFSK